MCDKLSKEQGVEAVSKLWHESQVIVFFGAGASCDSGLPIGDELEKKVGRPPMADGKTLARLRRTFLDPNLEPNSQHRLLALLLARFYITTNWDRLLERSFEELLGRQCGRRFHKVIEEGDITNIHKKSHTCIHLHGDLEIPSTVVWGDGSYFNAINRSNLVDQLVAVLLAMHPALFVGYSLRDLDVVGKLVRQSQWNVGMPPERFAVLPGYDTQAIDRCRELGIRPICLAQKKQSLGSEVEDFLTRLWEQIEGYRIYTRPLDDTPEDTLPARYERFWALYRAGQFRAARDISDQLLREGIDWRQDIPMFARFAYFTIKVNDKLEDWERVRSLDNGILQAEFSRIQHILPSKAYRSIRSQYEAGLAMPLLRSWRLNDALKHVNESLTTWPHSSTDPDLMCLHGDRYTIRAITRLAIWVSKKRRTSAAKKLLENAQNDLDKAKPIFRKFGKMGRRDEVHYLGRYYGACVFLKLALMEVGRSFAWESLLKDCVKSHNAPKCVPYGKLAGEYCEAYCRYRFIMDRKNKQKPKQKQKCLETALEHLSCAEQAVKNPGPLVRVKIHALAVLIADELRKLGSPCALSSSWQAARDSALEELRKGECKFVDTVGLEQWLKIPVN